MVCVSFNVVKDTYVDVVIVLPVTHCYVVCRDRKRLLTLSMAELL